MSIQDDLKKFQQSFVDAETFYASGAYAPLDPLPPLSKVAQVAVPRGYFDAIIDETEALGDYLIVTLRKREGELPVGKSGQYTSVQIMRTAGNKTYASTYAAFFCNYPSNRRWQLYVPREGYLASLSVGDTLRVSRPMGDFGYVSLRDANEVLALCCADSIAPILSIADGIAQGKYDAVMRICVYGDVDPRLQVQLNELCERNERLSVRYLAEFTPPPHTEGISVFCSVSARYPQLLHLAKGVTANPKYLRTVCPAKVRNEQSGAPCTLTVHTFDRDYTLSAACGETLIDVLERSDVKIESRCRTGECGWCRVRFLGGQLQTVADTKLRMADKEYGYTHACKAVLTGDAEIAIDY